ncbi:butyrophilin subfamily 1 member A1-like [Tachyglossus aculeatus]|uniref:butyrophilin subfamily 1 member A1-like n=1 Tax=Tachyglossus aculeatus TaxID=9261 RepID=UPI0018F616F3|nr:butyrophilin subfamily 1 member A1-like [Tachyglossus aculeatus]
MLGYKNPVNLSAGIALATTVKKMVNFPDSFLPSCLISHLLLLLLQLPILGSAQFVVIGPAEPILAQVGGDAELPCHLDPTMSAENLEVRWIRSQSSDIVHLYKKGEDQLEKQMEEYRGRTELVRDTIATGSVSLRISNVTISDDGEYQCLFIDGSFQNETNLEVHVAAVGSDPLIHLEGHEKGGIRLGCTSTGWYPEPQVHWRDVRRETIPSLSESRPRASDGLFGVVATVIIREGSVGTVSCSIRNPRLSQEKGTEVSIAGLFFPRTNPWKIATIVILSILGLFLGNCGLVFWIKILSDQYDL